MDKRVKLIFLFLLISFLCVGCGNADAIRTIRHSGFALSGAEFICPNLYPANSSNGEYDKIRFFTTSHVITIDGSIYNLSMGQYYSNETNCKKSSFSPRIVSVFDDNIVRASDKKIYNLGAMYADGNFVEVTPKDSNYYLYYTLMADDNVYKIYTVNQDKGYYYVLMRDGNIYNYTVSKSGNNIVGVSNTSIAYNKNNFGGEIIDFKYAGDSTSTFIRTKTAIYRMAITNKAECTAYVDVNCEYKMAKDEGLTEYIDHILAFSGNFLITVDGKEFSVSSL